MNYSDINRVVAVIDNFFSKAGYGNGQTSQGMFCEFPVNPTMKRKRSRYNNERDFYIALYWIYMVLFANVVIDTFTQ